MSEAERLLNTLREISEPSAPQGVSGWIILANLLVLFLLLAAFYRYWQFKKKRWRYEVTLKLRRCANLPIERGLLSMAKILREVIVLKTGHCPKLTGDEWLAFLDQQFTTDWFTEGDGQIFGNAMYQPMTARSPSLSTLCVQIEHLMNRQSELNQEHSGIVSR